MRARSHIHKPKCGAAPATAHSGTYIHTNPSVEQLQQQLTQVHIYTQTQAWNISSNSSLRHIYARRFVKLCVCVFKLLVTLGSGLHCSHSTYSNIPVVSERVSMSMHCTYSDNEINIRPLINNSLGGSFDVITYYRYSKTAK